MKIYLGTDHAGFELKEAIKAFLSDQGHAVEDCGARAFVPDDDFLDFVVPAARGAAQDPGARAIILGGSGQGEAMAANRLRGVRAVIFYGPAQAQEALDAAGHPGLDGYDIVRLSRVHNNSNVLSIGARFVTGDQARQAIRLWLETPYEPQDRFERRNSALDGIGP